MNVAQLVTEYFSILATVIQGAFFIITWALFKVFVRKSECAAIRHACAARWEALNAAHNGFQNMDAELEARLDAMPPAEEIRVLRVDLAEFKGELSTLAAQVQGANDVMSRLEKNLDLLMRRHLKEDCA